MSDQIAMRMREVIDLQLRAASEFTFGREAAGLRSLKQAIAKATALGVALERARGQAKLPKVKR